MHLNSSLVCQAISAITEILTASIYRDGKATKLLTEPLLEWFGGGGAKLVALAIEGESRLCFSRGIVHGADESA